MFTLSRIKLLKRSLLVLIPSIIAIIVGAFVSVKNIQTGIVEAAGGQAAVSSSGVPIQYDNNGTYRYSVEVDGKTYKALCAEPSKDPPAGASYDYSPLNNDKIKLLVYLAINTDSSAANELVNTLYGSLASNDDQRFAYIHATIGAINGDYTGLSTNLAKIQEIANGTGSGSLAYAISHNVDAWLIAKNYTLYATNPDSSSLYQSVVWIKYNPQYGNLKIQKCDNETKKCDSAQGQANFSDIKFEVYNASGSRIYDPSNETFYDNNALMRTGTTDPNGLLTIANLPIDIKYQIQEVRTNEGYLLTAPAQITTIATSGTTNDLKFYDDIVRGDLKFTKIDTATNEPMANVAFQITSTTTGETHIVVTDENGLVDTSAAHSLHTNHTNGYDNIEKDQLGYLGYGTWFGLASAVNDDKGALPYDTYEITELACNANKFCYDIGTKKENIEIRTEDTVVDLGDWGNDCAEFNLKTTAVDDADGDKLLAVDQDVKIRDTVEYCLKENMEFTIKGILMDKTTKKPLLVDGKTVEQTINISPEEACGTVDMLYSFNTRDLGGADLVVFEDLYYGEELLLSHSDFDDEGQSISVAPNMPDTGALTDNSRNNIEDKGFVVPILASVSLVSIYIGYRLISRRRFLSYQRKY